MIRLAWLAVGLALVGLGASAVGRSVARGCLSRGVSGVRESQVVDLRPGERLEGASWRGNNLWLLTRRAREGEVPGEHVFREVSRTGWLEGEMVVREK